MNEFARPIKIGKLTVPNRVFLAPLAGVSDIPMRRICQELGAGLTYVEMLSSAAINHGNKRTVEMMQRHPSEKILGVQVTGPNATDVARAIETLDSRGFETIDINMGCPVKKVVNAGCGSAILKDLDRVSETIKTARSATSQPLSGKIRLGYTREAINVADTTRRIVLEHADMFTIHGRTRSESYNVKVDIDGIQAGISSAKNSNEQAVAVANGDVFCHKSATAMLRSGCDAVMVSRGALGNPWVFQEILEQKSVFPTVEEWIDVVARHLQYQIEHYGNTRFSAVMFRKHLLWYTKGYPGSKALREKLNHIENLEVAFELVREFARNLPQNLCRFESEQPNSLHEYDPKYEMDRTHDRGVGDEGMA